MIKTINKPDVERFRGILTRFDGILSNISLERRRRGKTKIRKFEEIWTSVERERVAERKGATGQGRWLGYSSWRQT